MRYIGFSPWPISFRVKNPKYEFPIQVRPSKIVVGHVLAVIDVYKIMSGKEAFTITDEEGNVLGPLTFIEKVQTYTINYNPGDINPNTVLTLVIGVE